jgi:hypothetical protein
MTSITMTTLDILIQKYGPVLNLKELGQVIKMSPAGIRNAVSAERFPIPTHRCGKTRVARADHVADYLDQITSSRG